MVTLLIVESPAKANKIQTFFPKKDILVQSTCGHIRDLKQKELSKKVIVLI